jgi:hypothetical protein
VHKGGCLRGWERIRLNAVWWMLSRFFVSDAQATGEHYISPRNIDVGGGWGGVGDKTYSCFHG